MTTQTQVYSKTRFKPSRTHDFLYDPVYTVSGNRDHVRSLVKAATAAEHVKKVPSDKAMFSDLRHHPRLLYQLSQNDPVPPFVSRQWHGNSRTIPSNVGCQTTMSPHNGVSGVYRSKYFNRPAISYLQQPPVDAMFAPTQVDLRLAKSGALGDGATKDTDNVGGHASMAINVSTQTDFRDGEAQTDPYSPEYVLRPGDQPELLTLATLSHGHGLPAGLAEVEMIERARVKRAWEATLPPLSDVSQLEKRKKMMDAMERKEWLLREQEIEKLQDARLEVLKKILKDREEHCNEQNLCRLDAAWREKQRDRELYVKNIRHKYLRALRKLTSKRNNIEGKFDRREVAVEYSDHSSQSFAPLTRFGVFPDRNSENYLVRSEFLASYEGLCELEKALPSFVYNPCVRAPRKQSSTRAGFVKRKYKREQQLADIHEQIRKGKTSRQEEPKPLRFLHKIEKPAPRPPTPKIDLPDQDEEERQLAIIFIQQVLRGRAMQNVMFEAKEKRIELIRELRTTHALQAAEKDEKKREKQLVLAKQQQNQLLEHRESCVDEMLGRLEGESLGDMLDFLSKELVRLQEERRIHAFGILAERRRRIREAEESGQRQREERRRREEDEIFKQIIKVHQVSVDTYLEDVILETTEDTSSKQARAEIEEMADKINETAYEAEKNLTDLQSEEIVAGLVHQFLIPEVKKELHRKQIKQSQKERLLAAHQEIMQNTTLEASTPLDGNSSIAKQEASDENAEELKEDLAESDNISANENIGGREEMNEALMERKNSEEDIIEPVQRENNEVTEVENTAAIKVEGVSDEDIKAPQNLSTNDKVDEDV